MITIKELLQDASLPGNYFAHDAYIRGDFESGLIENRQGKRLLAISETLMQSIYTTMNSEVGSSAGIVLFKCGLWWGKNFYQRFSQEVNSYYQKSISEMKMIELLQCLKECWKTHGWGNINLDFDYYKQGFLVVKIEQSAFARVIESATQPSCFLEAGLLSAFFSQLSGTKLHCVQTACESLGVECNLFVLGLANRLEPIADWLEQGEHHNNIMERLCRDGN
jgi:uncharacterized protein